MNKKRKIIILILIICIVCVGYIVTAHLAVTNKVILKPAPINYKCKRATTLHTEVCNQTDATTYCRGGGYSAGQTITYGQIEEGDLNSGDAFDCDVNGDGTYDSKTERFYYVTDLDTDSDYAVLIYYNNVLGGIPNNTATFAYNIFDSDYLGPETARSNLPTTTQWKNISLAYPYREILNTGGDVLIDEFSYTGYSARLLTEIEVYNACGWGDMNEGLLDNCQYLLENTKYTNNNLAGGHWLETLYTNEPFPNSALNITSYRRTIGFSDSVRDDWVFGVRPAIEVEKDKIFY